MLTRRQSRERSRVSQSKSPDQYQIQLSPRISSQPILENLTDKGIPLLGLMSKNDSVSPRFPCSPKIASFGCSLSEEGNDKSKEWALSEQPVESREELLPHSLFLRPQR